MGVHLPRHQIDSAYDHLPSDTSSSVAVTDSGGDIGTMAFTSAATASTLASRDSAGRMKVAAPSASTDVATKGSCDTAIATAVAAHPAIYSVTVDTDDFTDSDTSQAIDLDAITGFPANSVVHDAWIDVKTPLSGGTVSAATATIGDAGAADELMAAQDVFTGVSGLVYEADLAALNTKEAAYVPLITIATTAGNLDDLTAGEIEIHIRYSSMPIDA